MSTPARSPVSDAGCVVVCTAEPIAAQGIRALLGECTDLKFQQAVASLTEIASILDQSRPSVLLLDRSLGPQVILDWLNALRANSFSHLGTSGIVIWGVSGNEPESVRFLRAGACGFLRKTADISAVLACLRAVAAGQSWMEELRNDKHLELTSREQEVLELIGRGFRNKEIAQELGISEGTVKIHVMHVFRKTGQTRHGLTLRALREQVSHPELESR